jgi:hypothetical protein
MDPRRREEIAAAVAAYNRANPTARLPHSAARLLAVMFAESDICRLSQLDLVTRGFGGGLSKVLRALVEAGFMTKQAGGGRGPDTYRLNPPSPPMGGRP